MMPVSYWMALSWAIGAMDGAAHPWNIRSSRLQVCGDRVCLEIRKFVQFVPDHTNNPMLSGGYEVNQVFYAPVSGFIW